MDPPRRPERRVEARQFRCFLFLTAELYIILSYYWSGEQQQRYDEPAGARQFLFDDDISLHFYRHGQVSRLGLPHRGARNDGLVEVRYFPPFLDEDLNSLVYFWPSVVNWLGLHHRHARNGLRLEARQIQQFNAANHDLILNFWSGVHNRFGHHLRNARNGERVDMWQSPQWNADRHAILYIWSSVLNWIVHHNQDGGNHGVLAANRFILYISEDRTPLPYFLPNNRYGCDFRAIRNGRYINAQLFQSRPYYIARDLSFVIYWGGDTFRIIPVNRPILWRVYIDDYSCMARGYRFSE